MTNELPDRKITSYLVWVRYIVRWYRFIKLKLRCGAVLKCGGKVNFGPNNVIISPTFAKFGNNINVGRDFYAESNFTIGNDVLLSSKVSFVGNDHRFSNKEKTIYYSGRLSESCVVIEGDNLIGFGVIVIGNVVIKRGCIVGAGSVVTRDLPSYTICAGVPAKPIRYRFK